MKEDIKHIADLARIEFTAHELEKFEKEFESILHFIGELSSADTGNTPELSSAVEGVLSLRAMREDREQAPLGDAAALVDTAPKTEGRWVAVKAVF